MSARSGARGELAGRRRAANGLGRRLELARSLVGYSADDEWHVRLTFELVAEEADDLTKGLYERLVQFPETSAFFLAEDGTPDREYIARRTESLKRWLLSIDAPLDEEAARRVVDIGRMHTGRAGNEGIRVHARYLVMTMGWLQTGLTALLVTRIEDRAELAAALGAWSKLLMIHLDLLLAGYDGASASTHWY